MRAIARRASAGRPPPSRRSRTYSSRWCASARPTRRTARMRRLLALTWKEFLQLKRDHLTLRMIVMVPLMQTPDLRLRHQLRRQAPEDGGARRERSYESRELVARMRPASTSTSSARVDSMRRAAPRARLGAGVGRRWSSTATSARTAIAAQPAQALLIVNASDSTTSSQAMSIAAGIATSAVDAARSRVQARLARARAAGRPARAALVQPGPADRQLHHPGPDRDHPDLHADQFTAGGDRARARARHARAAAGDAGHPHAS